jgi:phosphohistidine phosphatase
MIQLLLLRHAKAAPNAGDGDFLRTLTPRGREDSERIGKYLARSGFVPDAALSSGSRRTGETLEIAMRQFAGDVPVAVDPRIYEGTPRGFLAAIQATTLARTRLLAVGHNPGIAELAALLAGGGDRTALRLMSAKYPTAALAIIAFDAPSFADVAEGAGRLTHFVTPKQLGGEDD